MSIPSTATELRAVIYCRQSRDSTGLGAAVDRQETACRGLAVARGWSVVEVVTDNDVSASTGKLRPGWQRVLGMIEAGAVEVVVAWHLDRITRTMRDLEDLIELTQAKGVGLATATGDIDLTTDSGRMVGRILAAVARGEVERKGARQALSNQQRVGQGRPRWSHRPFGYEKDGTHRKPEAELLRQAYADLIAGSRLFRIRDRWNEAGLTTTVGGAWTTQSLGKLIRDPRNYGVIRYRGEDAGRGGWEPMVSEDTWRVAVSRLGTRADGGAAGTSDALLVTVARCGRCDGRIWTTQHNGQERAYSCAKGCVHLPVEWADGRVFLAVSEILEDGSHRDRWEHLAAEQGQRAGELQTSHALLTERLSTLADDYATGLLTREQMLSGSERVREQMTRLEAELGTLTDLERPVFDLEWFAQRLEELGTDERRALVRSTVDVRLHPRGKGNRALRPDLVEVTAKLPAGRLENEESA